MRKKDRKISISCIVCHRCWEFYVNSEDFGQYIDENPCTDPKSLFPYLNDEEIELLETGICSNCI